MGRKRKILAARRLEVDPTPEESARFDAKVKPGRTIPDGFDTPCLEWQAATDGDGYARFKFRGVNMLGHRFAYARDVGPIDDGHDVDHGCTNRRCVNSDHLEQKPSGEHRAMDGARSQNGNGNGADYA